MYCMIIAMTHSLMLTSWLGSQLLFLISISNNKKKMTTWCSSQMMTSINVRIYWRANMILCLLILKALLYKSVLTHLTYFLVSWFKLVWLESDRKLFKRFKNLKKHSRRPVLILIRCQLECWALVMMRESISVCRAKQNIQMKLSWELEKQHQSGRNLLLIGRRRNGLIHLLSVWQPS